MTVYFKDDKNIAVYLLMSISDCPKNEVYF